MMFEFLFLMFSWLPAPLNVIAFGSICIVLILALMRLIALIIEMIPFV